MKKVLIGLILICIIFACASAFSEAESLPVESISKKILRNNTGENKDKVRYNNIRYADMGLPASLITIEDEAFAGTAITAITLPKNVKVVGDYAFADIQTLHKIDIPNTTEYIGENAFKGSNGVIISGAPKGYVRTWAYENGIPFHPITSFYSYKATIQIMGVYIEKGLLLENTTVDKSELPQTRIARTLVVDKYSSVERFHVQGRAPPIC